MDGDRTVRGGDVDTPSVPSAARPRDLAAQISESRRQLEALAERIGLGSAEDFETTVRPSMIDLLRDLRANLVRLWHRVNSTTNWPGSLRGPMKVDALPPLLQDAMVDAFEELGVQPRFEVVDNGAVRGLVDHDFPDGTAMELALGHRGSASFPLARLAVALIPSERYLVLLVGWMIGRVERGSEWPKSRLVLAKIGSLRAERWHREEKEMFLLKMIDDFHSAVSEEIGERVSRLAEAASPGPEQELDLTGGGC